MKLQRIKILEIKHRPLLNGLELSFPANSGSVVTANCFIGVNGSGKSQLLETIAEIFLYLDTLYGNDIVSKQSETPPFLFEIAYTVIIQKKKFIVEFIQAQKSGKPELKVLDYKDKPVIVYASDIGQYLPTKVIGYSSGENETISIPFHSYYDVYAHHTARRAIEGAKVKDYEPRFYYMDYNTNLGIVISNLVFENAKGISNIKKELQLNRLKNFQVIIQTNQPAAPKIRNSAGETGVHLTKDLITWRDYLIRAATCYDYDEKSQRYTLDFHMNAATRTALIHFFESAYNLYTALYKFELLNNLMVDAATRKALIRERKNRKLITKMPSVANKDKVLHYSEIKLELKNKQTIDYLSLSDGEHQFFNIFGTILMVDHDNSLFLLDEPETHFNPKWRRVFISHLKAVTKNRKQDLFVTSHSPFIVCDSPKEAVYIFERVSKDQIKVRYPEQETFGASYNHILQMAFDLDEVLSEEASSLIESLKKETNPKKIEEGLARLGESPHVMPLYRRIELLSKKKN